MDVVDEAECESYYTATDFDEFNVAPLVNVIRNRCYRFCLPDTYCRIIWNDTPDETRAPIPNRLSDLQKRTRVAVATAAVAATAIATAVAAAAVAVARATAAVTTAVAATAIATAVAAAAVAAAVAAAAAAVRRIRRGKRRSRRRRRRQRSLCR